LTAGLPGRFEYDDPVAALPCDASRLQSRRPRADDYHLARLRGAWHLMRHGQFTPGRGVMQAIRRSALIDPIETVIGPHTRANFILTSLDDLSHDMRVGHVRTSHADHVDLAGGDRVPGRRDIIDPSGMERRESRCRANLAGQFEVR
jgi:hypothetical protein